MTAKEILDFLSKIETLKSNTRHSWTREGTRETVAAHSWRLAVFALLMKEDHPNLDMEKVVTMCLIHDFGEAVTGDIPIFQKGKKDEEREKKAIVSLLSALPQKLRNDWQALFDEMDKQKTAEARLFKVLDKLEAVHQHNEADLSTWLLLEETLNQTYGEEEAANFPDTKNLRERMRQDTIEKLQKANRKPELK